MINIPAKVARTADELKHINRLAIPNFGVTKLFLKSASGKASKSYLPPGSPKADGAPAGADTFHFASEKEKVQIVYQIANPFVGIQKAKLELFRRNDNKALWTRELKPDEFSDGEHQIEWDGKAVKSADFPDEYVTVEHSPYKLKLTVGGNGRGNPRTAWTYFHILVADIDLEWGVKGALKESRDRLLHDRLLETDPAKGGTLGGKLPQPGETKEVRLVSNLFETAFAQLLTNAAFDVYKTAWGDGPGLAIFGKIWVKDSEDKKVEAPKALGKIKFLWDWEDEAENTSRHHAKAKTFLDNALDYDKAATEPKGDNCHVDRGGKRGPAAAAVFPSQAGYAPAAALTANTFPFKVEACSTRKWAAFSYPWGSGLLAGKTGVLFQPSRMAGDAYKLSVYLAYDKKPDGKMSIDTKDAPPLKSPVKKSTGVFQIWREVHLIKHIKKKAALPSFSFATFRDYNEKANVRMEDKTGGAVAMTEADYNSKMTTARSGRPEQEQAAIDPATNQYTSGDYATHFRSHADFLTAYQTAKSWTDAELAAWLTGSGSNVNTPAKYHLRCKTWAQSMIEFGCNGYIHASDGINIIQFSGLYNHQTAPGGKGLNGYAELFAASSLNKCAFVQCATPGSYVPSATNKNTLEQTITHEIGHQMFMPHSTDSVDVSDPYLDATAHDQDWHHCMMSYAYGNERKYCGFCLLRLRGWDKTKLKPAAADNKK